MGGSAGPGSAAGGAAGSGAAGGTSGSASPSGRAGSGAATPGGAGVSPGAGPSGGAGATTSGAGTPGGAATSGAAGGGAAGSSAATTLTSQQRTQITRSFAHVNARPITSVNFAISIGTVIPATVELYDVPVDVVQVVPAYRGYRYFVVGNQIVIVEPSARRIVAVIERTG